MSSQSNTRKSGLFYPLLSVLGSALLAAPLAMVLWQPNALATDRAVKVPPPQTNGQAAAPSGMQTAVLSGGCFWGMETVFQHVKGVQSVVSGYAGGNKATANYETVSTGETGHAESVRINYDPQKVSYGELLRIYFSVAHNPTELNRQGPDTGPQYRSNIFYANKAQEHEAQAYIAQLKKADVYKRPIVTRVDPLKAFYPAEAYHQNFAYRNPHNLYIVINDAPKVKNLKQMFPREYRQEAVTTVAAK